jgi:hypothetical protein
MALGGEIDLVLSRIVIEETRRNLLESAPENVPYMEFVLQSVPYEIARPSKGQVIVAGKHTALKEAIAAAAREAAIELLVTLDKKHQAVRRLKQGEGSKMRKAKNTLLENI